MISPLRQLLATIAPARLDGCRSWVPLLPAGLGAAWLAWAFVQIGAEMVEGGTRAFDMQLLRAAQSLRAGRPWMAEVMRDLSGLGSTAVLTLFTTSAVGYLALVSARATGLLVATAVITGSVGVSWLKAGFGRLRPAADFAELVAPGLSFPSGHAGVSAIVFLTLGALLASTRSRAVERLYILATASVMTLLVGLSRIALGVHWATDVLAGWAFGAAWALVWLLLARRSLHANRRSRIPGPPGQNARHDPSQPGPLIAFVTMPASPDPEIRTPADVVVASPEQMS